MQAEDIRFADFPVVRRGFDVNEVQQFLGRVALEFERLSGASVPGRTTTSDLERLIRAARQTADTIVAEAEENARQINAMAAFERDQFLAQSREMQRQAVIERDTARSEAARIRAEAEAHARQLVEAARREVSAYEGAMSARIELLNRTYDEALDRVLQARDVLIEVAGPPSAAIDVRDSSGARPG